MPRNQQIVLDNRPQGEAVASNFKLVATDTPALKDGEVLVRHHYLSLDPYMRGRMNEGKSYAQPQPLGQVMIGGTAGEVVESRHPKFAPGDKMLGQGGWPDWNANGEFVNILSDSAKAKGVTPMYTLYSMAAQGENNMSVLTDDKYMKAYWDGAKLLYQRIAVFGGPAAVQFEPDFWAYVQQASKSNPSSLPVKVGALAPDCAGLGENAVGLGKCLVVLGRKYAPKAMLGFHVSGWADGDPAKIVKFMLDVGAGDADFLTTDMLDRDAGCFEAGTEPVCSATSTTR